MTNEVEQLHVGANESLATLRQRLAGFRGRRVLLIWSADGQALRRKLDLVLLQREAHRRAIQLAIVTADAGLAAHAAELNISAFASLEHSQHARWKRARPKVFLPRHHRPRADLQPEDLEFIASRVAGRASHLTWRTLLLRALVLLLLLGVAGFALYLVVPAASVELSLRVDEIAITAEIIADSKATALNLQRGVIPALTLRESVETTATVPSTGQAWLESVSAAAVVIFSNLTNTRVDIPRGAILGTSAGEPIIFETTADVVVPAGAGQSVGATVVAIDGYRGAIGNVDAGMINTVFGALGERVSVINLAPSAGGRVPDVRVVTAEDRARLLASARIQLQSLAFERMRASLTESQVIILESVQLLEERKDWTTFSADIGTMTSELSVTMRAVVSALTLDERYARQVATARLHAALPLGSEVIAGSVTYARGPFSLDQARGLINFAVSGRARVRATLDPDELRQQLAGAGIQEAMALLSANQALSRAIPPRIAVRPAALAHLPRLPLRIDLEFREPTA